MQDTPFVFVVLPTYNSASTVEESINSVLGQTYTQIKLIVVDDGSTDSTASILNRIKETDPRVHVIKKENSGAGDSRNIAVKYALNEGAEFLAFCDSDDVWTMNKLNIQMQLFTKLSDADIVVTDMISYDSPAPSEHIREIDQIPYTHLDNIFKTLCLHNFTFQPVTAVVRSELFKRGAEYTKDRSGQDFYPFFRLAFEGYNFYKVEHQLYRERQLQGSLQRSPKSGYQGGQARVRAVKRLKHEMADSSLMTSEKLSLLGQAHDKYCSWMLSGARRSLSYKEQLLLLLKNVNHFKNKTIAMRELFKSIFYPALFSIKKH